MKKYKNKKVKIHLKVKGADLYYSALVTEVSKTHISFLDKYGDAYTFKREYIEEISSV